MTQAQEEQMRLEQQVLNALGTVAQLRKTLPAPDWYTIVRLRSELLGLRDGPVESRRLLAAAFLKQLPKTHTEEIDPEVLKELHQRLRQEERSLLHEALYTHNRCPL